MVEDDGDGLHAVTRRWEKVGEDGDSGSGGACEDEGGFGNNLRY